MFAGLNKKRRLNGNYMLELLREMRSGATVHGFRSTFRDWAAERTKIPDIIAEMALAHAVGDKTEQAYKRTELFDKRALLMNQWAAFLAKPLPASSGTVDLEAERQRRSAR